MKDSQAVTSTPAPTPPAPQTAAEPEQLPERNEPPQEVKQPPSAALPGDSGNIDKIRDILFGNQVKEIAKKLTRLEERIVKADAEMREDTKNRLDSIETYIKDEIASLSDRLRNEQKSRSESEKNILGDLKDTTRQMEARFTRTEDQISTNTRNLREQLLEQSKNLSADIKARNEQTSLALEKIAGELRDDKVDRAALSGLFAELSMRLSDASPLSSLLDSVE